MKILRFGERGVPNVGVWGLESWRGLCGDARVTSTARAVRKGTNAREHWFSCGSEICIIISIAKSVRSNTVFHGLLPCRFVVGSVVLSTRTPSIA